MSTKPRLHDGPDYDGMWGGFIYLLRAVLFCGGAGLVTAGIVERDSFFILIGNTAWLLMIAMRGSKK